MTVQPKPEISTALVLALAALPISVFASATLYSNHDAFWPLAWNNAALPSVWIATAGLAIRDVLKRRSWRQTLGVVALLSATAVPFFAERSYRFWNHNLFSSSPSESLLRNDNRIIFLQKFRVCSASSDCRSPGPVNDTRTFRFAKPREGCCTLRVVNGQGEKPAKHKVDAYSIELNGQKVQFLDAESSQISKVSLNAENTIRVQMSGPSDAYIYVVVFVHDPA